MAWEDATGGWVDWVKKMKERISHGRERGNMDIFISRTHVSGQLNGEN
jgi:hypothetical protein